tara:strand:+ start:2306 stop:3145 length:840 start_codon:yes stop_codon:yes gene_type:complete
MVEQLTSATEVAKVDNDDYNDYIVYLKTVQASAFCKTVECLKEILNDTNITFDKDGLRIMTLDGLKTSLINMRMYATNFEKYICEHEIFVGVNMANLFKLIKSIENNDHLTLYVKRDEIYTLGIIINNSDKNRSTEYQLKLLDLDQNKIEVPSTEFKNVITLPSSDFQRICRDMQNIGDKIAIENYGSHIKLTCNGTFANQTTTISGINKEVTEIDDDYEVVRGIFALKHLCLFTKCTNLCNTVELYLKNDYPLLIKYGIANLGRIYMALTCVDDDEQD